MYGGSECYVLKVYVIVTLILCMLLIYCSHLLYVLNYVFFFFQAEDGIRDIGVTGVQTCALPICRLRLDRRGRGRRERAQVDLHARLGPRRRPRRGQALLRVAGRPGPARQARGREDRKSVV